jgi:hypothetical protein
MLFFSKTTWDNLYSASGKNSIMEDTFLQFQLGGFYHEEGTIDKKTDNLFWKLSIVCFEKSASFEGIFPFSVV